MHEEREEQKRRLVQTLQRVLGPDLFALLHDPLVSDILLNENGVVWEDRLGVGLSRIGTLAATNAETVIRTAASMVGQQVIREGPILECELWLGARFEGIIAPVVQSPVFAIRKHAVRVYTLSDYVKDGIMTLAQAKSIVEAVAKRQNILIVGGTGSGKTTLGNAISHEIGLQASADRIVFIEDTRELQCHNENVVFLRTTPTVTHRDLLRATLRLRPDRIVLGEVRGGEALDLLKAWNTGHDGGFCTIHANGVHQALQRIEQCIGEVSQTPMQRLIAEAVDLIVWIGRDGSERRVRGISRVLGFDDDYRLEPIGE